MQKFPGLRAHKVAVGQTGSLDLPAAFAEAFVPQINPHAKLVGKFSGIARQEMAMPAADLPDKAAGRQQERSELGAQNGPPLGDVRDESGFIVHGFNCASPRGGATPKRQLFRRRGRRMTMASPAPSVFSAQTRPSCNWTMCFTMLRPRPVPPVSRERPFSTR